MTYVTIPDKMGVNMGRWSFESISDNLTGLEVEMEPPNLDKMINME